MNRCKTCRHWLRRESAYTGVRGPSVMGDCASPRWQYHSWLDDDAPELSDGVLYSDWEGYGAECVTGEDFGCIHHEARGAKG